MSETLLFDDFGDASQYAKRVSQDSNSSIRVFRQEGHWAVEMAATDDYVDLSGDAEDSSKVRPSVQSDQTKDWGDCFDDFDSNDWEDHYSGPEPAED